MALNTLSALAPLAPFASTIASQATTATAAPATTSGPSWLTGTIAQISIILLGLLLIGAGIFSFDKTKTVIAGHIDTVRGAADAAAAAALA